MTFRDVQAPLPMIWPAIAAGVVLLFASALSLLSINILGQSYGFAFLPLMVIAIWPRQAQGVTSILFVFTAGVFTDWATGGVVGQWALVFCVIWGVLRPALRSYPYAFFNMMLIWIGICGLAILLLTLSGWIVFGRFPDFAVLGRQTLLGSVLMPFVLILRRWLARWRTDGEDWDY